MCPHTPTHVSSYYCTCVLILLYMCPHTDIYVSCTMCPHTTTCAGTSSHYEVVADVESRWQIEGGIDQPLKGLCVCVCVCVYVV